MWFYVRYDYYYLLFGETYLSLKADTICIQRLGSTILVPTYEGRQISTLFYCQPDKKIIVHIYTLIPYHYFLSCRWLLMKCMLCCRSRRDERCGRLVGRWRAKRRTPAVAEQVAVGTRAPEEVPLGDRQPSSQPLPGEQLHYPAVLGPGQAPQDPAGRPSRPPRWSHASPTPRCQALHGVQRRSHPRFHQYRLLRPDIEAAARAGQGGPSRPRNFPPGQGAPTEEELQGSSGLWRVFYRHGPYTQQPSALPRHRRTRRRPKRTDSSNRWVRPKFIS